MRVSMEDEFAKGVVQYEKARLDEAERAFQQVIEAEPDFHINGRNSWQYLGNIRRLQRRFREAVDYFSKSLELNPGDEDVLLARGALLIEGHDYRAALADFTAVLNIPPAVHRTETATLHYIIADIYLKLEQYEDALRHAGEARRLKPEKSAFKILLAEIQAIMKKKNLFSSGGLS